MTPRPPLSCLTRPSAFADNGSLASRRTTKRSAGVANILGAIARAHLLLGDPAKARNNYREELVLRDQFSPDLAGQVEVRRERAGLSQKLGDLSISLGKPQAARAHFQQALTLHREIAAQNPDETQAQRDVLLSLQKVANHELIYVRNSKIARAILSARPERFS